MITRVSYRILCGWMTREDKSLGGSEPQKFSETDTNASSLCFKLKYMYLTLIPVTYFKQK